MAYCRRRGYRVLKRNLRFARGEIDLLAEDRARSYLIVLEVRGAGPKTWAPSRTLSAAKKRRLERLALQLSRRHRKPVHLEFLEVRGPLNLKSWKLRWFGRLLKWKPEWFGLSLRAFSWELTDPG